MSREKRSLALNDDILVAGSPRRKRSLTNRPNNSHGVKVDDTAALTESLMQSQLNGHKIRHLGEKVRALGENSHLVQTVLHLYCKKETYYMTQFVNCTQENSTAVHQNNSLTPVGAVHLVHYNQSL